MTQDGTSSTTPELRAKVGALLATLFDDDSRPPLPPVLFIEMARRHGVALVDPDRQRFLIDEVVHFGVLFRLNRLRALERSHAHHQPPASVWAGLLSSGSVS